VALARVTRTVVLDAFGTLVELDPPVAPLARALGLPAEVVGPALRAEMAFYRAHLMEGGTAEGLAGLRRRCAEVLRDGLGPGAPPVDEVQRALLGALTFSVPEDVVPALRAWRAEGARLVVLSNWDLTLHEVLERAGLRALVDDVLTSAELGVAKPDPAAFAAAAPDGRALHVGDEVETDVRGALAAGHDALLLARDGAPAPPGVRAVGSLPEAVEHWRQA
jgi:putative hydrolase of the HAD superfamily